MKTCTKCGETKDFSEFYKLASSKDGHDYYCRECAINRRKEIRIDPILQLQKAVRSSILIENKILSKENKKICSGCKSIFFISDLRGVFCKECTKKIQKKHKSSEAHKEKRRVTATEYRLNNKEKIKDYMKEYHVENKEKILEKCRKASKKLYEKNREERLKKMKEYREQNKDKLNEKRRRYREENKEKINEQQRQYRLKRKEAIS